MNIFTNQRFTNESQRQYNKRRQKTKEYIERKKHGRMLWPASQGTYIRAKHGELK